MLKEEELAEQCSISLQDGRHHNAGQSHDIKMCKRGKVIIWEPQYQIKIRCMRK
jgi:hypothetical protein